MNGTGQLCDPGTYRGAYSHTDSSYVHYVRAPRWRGFRLAFRSAGAGSWAPRSAAAAAAAMCTWCSRRQHLTISTAVAHHAPISSASASATTPRRRLCVSDCLLIQPDILWRVPGHPVRALALTTCPTSQAKSNSSFLAVALAAVVRLAVIDWQPAPA